MKANNTKKVNKKFKMGLFLKILVSALLLTSMLVSTLFGTVNAEYVKSFSKKLDFAATPNTSWVAWLKDGAHTEGVELYYENLKSITQNIVINSKCTAGNAVYEIKIPVRDPGLYTIDFTVRFIRDSYEYSDFFVPTTTCDGTSVVSLNLPVGCKVNTRRTVAQDFFKLPTTLTTDEATKEAYNKTRTYGPGTNNSNGFHDYQWKTLAPGRAENVSLTFKATEGNLAIWSWDLRGFTTNATYTLTLNNIKITKIDDPDANEPYIDFSDTHYLNNALFPTDSYKVTTGSHPTSWTVQTMPAEIKGKNEAGKTRTSVARGTYVTEATYNSMTMQAEPLVFGYHSDNIVDATYARETWNYTDTESENYTNLVSFGFPIKNVERGKSYKVTFDVGFARQGTKDIANAAAGADYADYASHDNIFKVKSAAGTLHFQSYLYKGFASDGIDDVGKAQAFSIIGVTDDQTGRGSYFSPNKALYDSSSSKKGAPVTRYDNFALINSGLGERCKYSTVASVNDLYHTSKTTLNNQNLWLNTLNAVRHTEYNGQNAIDWITFTNTTFTFTVDTDTNRLTDKHLSQLRWVWALDSLEAKSWYRIKFDNVRIEEVVSYGSNVENDSLTINGSKVGFSTYENIGLYRGANGTGQNFQARNDPDAVFPVALMNVFGPVYDAASDKTNPANNKVVANDGNQQIGLSGYAVCEGGIEKYVWSADGGETWYDMESQYLSDITNDTILGLAEYQAENWAVGLDRLQNSFSGYTCNFVTFSNTTGDGKNAQYSIVANLKGTPYEGAFGLDIIFAAIPCNNPNARLELIRITNYNELTNYRTYTSEIESDIEVRVGDDTVGYVTSKLNATYDLTKQNSENPPENKTKFSTFKGYNFEGYRTSTEGFSKRIDNFSTYEDIPPTFSNIPVKKELTIRGWAMLEHNGAQAYYWSVDYGKTWHICGGNTGSAIYADKSDVENWEVWGTSNHRHKWYDGKTDVGSLPNFIDHLWFNEKDQGLTANLSDYVGQTVDIIFAGKSRDNNTFCPVARIDNVAVYGDYGTFFVHLDATREVDNVTVHATEIKDTETGEIKGRIPLYTNDGRLNGYNYWRNADDFHSISSIMSCNVDIANTRVFNKEAADIVRGKQTLSLCGWAVIHGGAKLYKYSLDGGTTWTVILNGPADTVDSGGKAEETMLKMSCRIDNTFVAEDCKGTTFQEGEIGFTIPKDTPTGRVNALIAVESELGYTYPLANIALNVTTG